ncbi:ATP-binding protein [Phyllobacterium calauticae]|uniref:ATP-binding protein n=1 Tax=Phyllobacterium calauticae TaxID=2817027 RepID=UPI001CBEA45F|nr:ATP-binding protein [Phyllobacterium calauticae]MBZ3691918.1 PAS domain S-box protein [Phyllobacterium calauticae]
MDRRTIASYWAAVIFVISIAFIGAATMIWQDYHSRMNAASQDAMNLARALAEHTTQIFVSLDALSRAVVEDSTNPIVSRDMLSEVLTRRAKAEPAATAIAIVDKVGHVVASNVLTYPVGLDMSADTSFKILSTEPGLARYVSPPYQTEFGGRKDWSGWTMNYARKIPSEDGSFNGFILIVVDGPFLYGFYNTLQEESGRVVGLVGQDGIVRASNVTEVIGRNLSVLAQTVIRNGGGIVVRPSARTGIERIFAYSKSSAAPLLAYVGVPTGPIYRAWLTASGIIVTALLALFAALVALGIILGKYIKNRASLMSSTLDIARERQEREFLESILNTGGALVAVTDAQGRFVVANSAFREIFQLEKVQPAAADAGTNPLEYALGYELQSIIDRLPYQTNRNVVSRSGQKRELSWTVTPIRTNDGSIKNLVAIGFDITERRAAELAIYQSGKMITLGEMATGIAHEINQPLATITMALDNLRERIKRGNAEPDFVDTNLQLVSEQIERTAAIVGHMRIYGHRTDGRAHPLDPARAIDGALSLAQTQIENSGIKIIKNYKLGQFQILGDLTLLEQILLNILLNARDAILEKPSLVNAVSESNEWIEVSIADGKHPHMIEISITDSGPGIAPANLDRLFEPFFTTKPIGSGTGLGLSLSYGMARDLGGSIEARNTGSGAEFRILMREYESAESDEQLSMN